MGVGDLQGLQDALDAAVLAPFPVQGVEDHVRLQGGQHLGQVATGVDVGDLGAQAFERGAALLARRQADLAFGRKAAKQQGDMVSG